VNELTWNRWAPWTGGIAAVLIAVSDFLFVHAAPPAISDSDQAITTFAGGQATGLRAQGTLEAIATAFLVCFSIYWARLIMQREEGPGRLGLLALAGGILAAACNWVWCATSVLLGSPGVGQPAATHIVYDFYQLLLAVLAFPGAIFLGAAAAASLQFGILPKWLGWGAALVALLQVLSAIDQMLRADGQSIIGLIGFVLFLLWLLISSIMLGRGSAESQIQQG
jgi:hypothetical protein